MFFFFLRKNLVWIFRAKTVLISLALSLVSSCFKFIELLIKITPPVVKIDSDKVCSKDTWDKVSKNGSSKLCGRQPLKNLKWYGLPKQTISLQFFKRLSCANFTWSIFEYFVPSVLLSISCFKAIRVFDS